MPMGDNALPLISNPLKKKDFFYPKWQRFFSPSKRLGQNVEKQMEKVENPFSPRPFSQGSGNLILFFEIHLRKNKTLHKKLSSTPVC
jgi:hypothetical protein